MGYSKQDCLEGSLDGFRSLQGCRPLEGVYLFFLLYYYFYQHMKEEFEEIQVVDFKKPKKPKKS